MRSEIILSQVIRKVFFHTRRIALEKEIKFKKQFASGAIVKACRNFLGKFGDPEKRLEPE